MIVSVVVFIIGSIVSYFVIYSIISEEIDDSLLLEKSEIIQYIRNTDRTIQELLSNIKNLEISLTDSTSAFEEKLSDTLIFLPAEQEEEPFRQLKFKAKIKDQYYNISLRRSIIEMEDIVIAISGIMAGLFLTIIFVLNLINYWSGRIIWKPFYNTLEKVSGFNLNSKELLNLPEVKIEEFNKLHFTLNNMADKLQKDYRTLKEFSENASHEMQTPLAVIRSKLDLMIQDNKLSNEQLKSIRGLYDAINRLSRLGQSLNLITKIENQEFENKENVNFKELIEKHLENITELIRAQRLKLSTDIEHVPVVEINPYMADTIVSNLIMNSVKHNVPSGNINIKCNKEYIIFENSGLPLKSDPQDLFKRFKKDNPTSDSPGLGLSIVNTICQQNGIKIEYFCNNGIHTIILHF